MRIKINIDLKVNRLVRNFVLIDLLLFGGWGLLEPIFSVFIIEKIPGATLVTAGAAVAIYFILKSILQLPVADYLDRHSGENDDFISLLLSLLLAGVAAFFFILVNQIWQLYLVQILHAVAFAFYTPAWSGIFSRHLDKEKVSFDWSLDSATVGLAGGASGFIGAIIAQWFGFKTVFFLVGILSWASVIFLITVPALVFPQKTTKKQESSAMKENIETKK